VSSDPAECDLLPCSADALVNGLLFSRLWLDLCRDRSDDALYQSSSSPALYSMNTATDQSAQGLMLGQNRAVTDFSLNSGHKESGREESGHAETFAKRVVDWYQVNKRTLPWRTDPPDVYKVWISEMMLQQTTVVTAGPYFYRFIARFPAVQPLAEACLEDVLYVWQGLGYYRRAGYLHKAAGLLAQQGFPVDYKGWLDLPGVGPYTAGAISSIALNQPAVALDGNIFRILARYWGLDQEDWRSRAADYGQKCLPATHSGLSYGDYTQGLMDLGATVCRPQKPLCQLCPLRQGCFAYHNQAADRIPLKAVRKRGSRTTHILVWLRRQGLGEEVQVRLCNAPAHRLLQGLWGLPTTPWQVSTEDFKASKVSADDPVEKGSVAGAKLIDHGSGLVGPQSGLHGGGTGPGSLGETGCKPVGSADAAAGGETGDETGAGSLAGAGDDLDGQKADHQALLCQGSWVPIGSLVHVFTHFTLRAQVWALWVNDLTKDDFAEYPEGEGVGATEQSISTEQSVSTGQSQTTEQALQTASRAIYPGGTRWANWQALGDFPMSSLMRKALAVAGSYVYNAQTDIAHKECGDE
jgi:A/G-specific adenine glycosylase